MLDREFPLGTKGIAVALEQYSLRNDAISLPCAVIDESTMTSNIQWMQSFSEQFNTQLCPHGKTTMVPEIFKRQLAAGAWGITVASPAQAEVALSAGAEHIIIANQIVGRGTARHLARLIKDSSATLYSCVDSIEQLKQLENIAQEENVKFPLLIELGVKSGRCGCRTQEQASELAEMIRQSANLDLMGVELYEGVVNGENAAENVRTFLDRALLFTERLIKHHQVTMPILTGSGSAWYDVVATTFADRNDINVVLRPGCYVVQDSGIYAKAKEDIEKRLVGSKNACSVVNLKSCLEVWASVISTPEQGKAIIGAGKRDMAYDAGLPVILRIIRDGNEIEIKSGTSLKGVHIMDQHYFVQDDESQLRVGDIVVLGTSHPCLTFDKWRFIAFRDAEDNITNWYPTYF
ncbi:alanine racemase [Vibrio sp.]|nr:alanine racemase [Vibrio sp.]